MKLSTIALVVAFFGFGVASAQEAAPPEKAEFGAEVVLTAPVGAWAEVSGPGLGAFARGDYALGERFHLGGRLGVLLQLPKDQNVLGQNVTTRITAFPLLAGASYYLLPGRLFATGELGATVLVETVVMRH